MPLLVRGPGVTAGAKTKRLTLNTDFAPTFAELAGASFPTDGRSLTPLLRSEEPWSWCSSVLLEKLRREGDAGRRDGKDTGEGREGETGAGGEPKSGPGGPPNSRAVRTETHKYVEYDNGKRELYDLRNDPYEMESLHESADPSLLENLKAKLDALESCSEEGAERPRTLHSASPALH